MALERRGVSRSAASLEAAGNPSLVKNLMNGHMPRVQSLSSLAEVLGLEFYFGPRRDVVKSDSGTPDSQTEPSGGSLPWEEHPGAFFPGEPDSFVPMEPRHTALAMALTAVYRHFEALNEYEQQHFVLDLIERSGMGVKMQIQSLDEVVIWLCTARRDSGQLKRILRKESAPL